MHAIAPFSLVYNMTTVYLYIRIRVAVVIKGGLSPHETYRDF